MLNLSKWGFMIKICFICTGNTCRSIMAERLMKKKLKTLNAFDIKVFSRGLNANGEMITDKAKKTLKLFKASSINRKSIKLGKIDKNTLYVTMTDQQKEKIKTDKVISFSSLIGRNIQDPYGKDLSDYINVANDLEVGIEVLLNNIKKWRDI